MEKNDQALILMVKNMVPAGLRGIVIAGLLAALMSSLLPCLIRVQLFLQLTYTRDGSQIPMRKLVRVGQIATVIMVLVGIIWIPIMERISGQLYTYLQTVQAYISPPIAAVFLLGIFFKRLNAKGAIASLWTGFVLGMGLLMLDIFKVNLSGVLLQINQTNFLHSAIFLFVICSIVLIIVSLLTEAPEAEKINKITYKKGVLTVEGDTSRKQDIVLSVILIVTIFALWIYFS